MEIYVNHMATYSILITDDGSSNFGAVAINAPATLPAGGTRLAIPWISNANAGNAPVVITSATTATPIACTFAAAHGLVTGDTVFIKRAVPGTATTLNITGTFQFTKTAATTGTLDGTVGSGTYVTSSAVGVKLTQTKELSMAIQAALRSCLDDRSAGN